MVYRKDTLRTLSGPQDTAGQWHTPLWRSISLVSALGWVLGVPRAILVGPVDPMWVVFQALGAGIIPAAAGVVTLWWTKGDLKGSVWTVAVASAVLFALALSA